MSLFFINGRNAFILIFLDAPEWRRYKKSYIQACKTPFPDVESQQVGNKPFTHHQA